MAEQEQGVLESIGSAALQGIDNMINFAIKGIGGFMDNVTSSMRSAKPTGPVVSLSGMKNGFSFGDTSTSVTPAIQSSKLGRGRDFHQRELSVTREIAAPQASTQNIDFGAIFKNNNIAPNSMRIESPYQAEVKPAQFGTISDGRFAMAEISPMEALVPLNVGAKQQQLGLGREMRM